VRRMEGGGGAPRPRGKVHAPERDDRSAMRRLMYKSRLEWSCNIVAFAFSKPFLAKIKGQGSPRSVSV
jgi:hypothetical protein